MRQPVVIGNWKLNGSPASTEAWISAALTGTGALGSVEIGFCPPFVLIPAAVSNASGSVLRVGGQDCAEYVSGAYTGEVSADLLRAVGCHYVILGHSERRTLFGETNAVIARKMVRALAAGLVPVLCVGETLAERESGQMEAVVRQQVRAVVDVVGIQAFERSIIAYEPVWAIGTGLTATPEQAQAMHRFIRGLLADYNPAVARMVRLQYGGSVKPDNAAELFAQPDIDGGLIGGASLKAEEFLSICRAAADAG